MPGSMTINNQYRTFIRTSLGGISLEMRAFVNTTPRQQLDAPPEPLADLGSLPKKERHPKRGGLDRAIGKIYQFVAAYPQWTQAEKNAGNEQFRYLVSTMSKTEMFIISSEKTLKDFLGQVKGWKTAVLARGAGAVYSLEGDKMQQRLKDLKGDVRVKHYKKVYSPLGGQMGKINAALRTMTRWIDDERAVMSTDIISDRLIFGASNLTPLLSLQGRFVFALSTAQGLLDEWKGAYVKECESAKIDQAEKERRAGKKAKTGETASAMAGEERCLAIKDWHGQESVQDSIKLTENEVVFRLATKGLWSEVCCCCLYTVLLYVLLYLTVHYIVIYSDCV